MRKTLLFALLAFISFGFAHAQDRSLSRYKEFAYVGEWDTRNPDRQVEDKAVGQADILGLDSKGKQEKQQGQRSAVHGWYSFSIQCTHFSPRMRH